MYVTSVIIRQFFEGPQSYDFTMESLGYLIIMTFLTFSALMYLIARQSAYQRFSQHTPVPRSLLDKHFLLHQPSITVLIPSYSEETSVVRKTMLSAALQEYPNMRVVLLIDDKPAPAGTEAEQRLEKTRALAGEIDALLAVPYQRFHDARTQFQKNLKTANKKKLTTETQVLADHFFWAAKWLSDLAQKECLEDHVDVFFVEQVLQKLAQDFKETAQDLLTSRKYESEHLLAFYHRLVRTFHVEMSFFERKRYASLSHEPNKAMNINSYIGLMGGMYKTEDTPDGILLEPVVDKNDANVVIPDSEFLLTLDADSILLQNYCLRLVYLLQQPDNADVAVAQTPYSSFRGAFSRIERLAGATTDIQHIIHQGMTHHNATFWVGANAVIRKKALEDIVEREWVGGIEVKRYIQDFTVIEDTESSIDMAIHNWRLVNYPERLSYSATPPDFGSLVIQRRRWANGGLLILPKLWKLVQKRKNEGRPISKMEFIIRLNYISSIAWSNVGLLFLLAYPYDGRLLSPLVLLAAVPYFLAMAIDLKRCRYNYSDVIRIYGFNLILLPVNIAGTLKSLEQALTAKKIPFARTPKVHDRTMVTLPYLISPLLVVGFSLFTLWRNIKGENWGNAIFAGVNSFAASWAIVSYIGVKNLLVDLWRGLTDFLYVEKTISVPITDNTKKT